MSTATARRGAVDAVKEVHRLICRRYIDVVDADLSRYFDLIPHDELLKSVARRIVDRHVLRLIKLWLKAPIEERMMATGPGASAVARATRAARPRAGASPLLANIYMNRFLKYWRLTGCGEAFRAHVIAYADDFVILSGGCAAEALAWTKAVMTRLGLRSTRPTSLKNAAGTLRLPRLLVRTTPLQSERSLVSKREPIQKSVQRLKTKVGNLLVPGKTIRGPKCATR